MKKQQIGKRGFGLMALALSIACSLAGGRMAMAQTVDPEAEGNVVIEVNNTDATNDDVLPQGGSLPCNAYLKGAGKPMTVVLVIPSISSTNSAKRLSFSNTSAVSTITLALNKDGTRSPFTIYATGTSQAVNDAKIEAHKDTEAGTLKTTGAASIYWFKKIEMLVGIPSTYATTGDSAPNPTNVEIAPISGGVGANLWATIDLMPSNSLGNAPQLSKFKVAVVQNSYAGNGVVAEWEAVTPGARFKYVRITNQVPKRADDVAQGASGPTYHQPTSLTVGGETTSDTPRVFPTLTTIEGDGATYRLKTLSSSNTWDDWCVLYDSSVGQVNPYAAISESSLDAGWNLFINLYQTASPSAFHIPGTAGSMILTNDSTQFANNLAKASEPYFQLSLPKSKTPQLSTDFNERIGAWKLLFGRELGLKQVMYILSLIPENHRCWHGILEVL